VEENFKQYRSKGCLTTQLLTGKYTIFFHILITGSNNSPEFNNLLSQPHQCISMPAGCRHRVFSVFKTLLFYIGRNISQVMLELFSLAGKFSNLFPDYFTLLRQEQVRGTRGYGYQSDPFHSFILKIKQQILYLKIMALVLGAFSTQRIEHRQATLLE
jgi:hypothetical protein